mmetsp:Transcript_26386/g.58093  ORF Transcript_26386/g.58093 Transcript_26386/m.58093 type:complete len:255 (+) Transcript_26386:380-1144(+)
MFLHLYFLLLLRRRYFALSLQIHLRSQIPGQVWMAICFLQTLFLNFFDLPSKMLHVVVFFRFLLCTNSTSRVLTHFGDTVMGKHCCSSPWHQDPATPLGVGVVNGQPASFIMYVVIAWSGVCQAQLARHWLKDGALLNILIMFVTPFTFHPSTCWLKEVASLNILYISVTLAVSQVSRGWLKATAPSNIFSIEVTFSVFHEFNGWLKDSDLWNMCPTRSTLDISQLPTGWLNCGLFANIDDMSVTFDVSNVSTL